MSLLTYRFRIKDANTARQLCDYAFAANQVWNYCCEVQRKAQAKRVAGASVTWPSAFTLEKLTAGASTALGIPSRSIGMICAQFARSRDKARRAPRFRASGGPRRALGWVPFKHAAIRVDGDSVIYSKRRFRFWKSREIEGCIKTGAFIQDARGRWYVTFQCEVADDLALGTGEVGIDLGLKTLATLSNGETVPALQHYRRYEAALARAQRARRKPLVRAIHAKIVNARLHHLHGHSTRIAQENRLIVVGNVSPSKLAKTGMAKSVLDAGWSTFKNQLRYKARRHGAVFAEVNEAWTSRTCSACGTLPASSPKGMGALRMRAWVCSDCGESHDRDINAARNILRLGLERQPPVEEIRIAA